MDARGVFVHDMRNQLGIILGYAELLLEAMPPSDPLRTDVVEIQQAAIAALRLMSSLAEPPA